MIIKFVISLSVTGFKLLNIICFCLCSCYAPQIALMPTHYIDKQTLRGFTPVMIADNLTQKDLDSLNEEFGIPSCKHNIFRVGIRSEDCLKEVIQSIEEAVALTNNTNAIIKDISEQKFEYATWGRGGTDTLVETRKIGEVFSIWLLNPDVLGFEMKGNQYLANQVIWDFDKKSPCLYPVNAFEHKDSLKLITKDENGQFQCFGYHLELEIMQDKPIVKGLIEFFGGTFREPYTDLEDLDYEKLKENFGLKRKEPIEGKKYRLIAFHSDGFHGENSFTVCIGFCQALQYPKLDLNTNLRLQRPVMTEYEFSRLIQEFLECESVD